MRLQDVTPFLRGRFPGQLVIQYTSHCNGDCPQCGMRRSQDIERSRLDRDVVKRLIDDAGERGFQAVSFTGGEPLLFLDDIIEFIDHAAKAGIPYIRTGTNGFLFMGSGRPDFEERINTLAARLAATKLYTFWISIDSVSVVEHERMRGLPGVIRGIERALPIFHAHGVYPSVNLGINRNTGGRDVRFHDPRMEAEEFCHLFSSAFRRFYTFVEGLGFTIVNACYPMSDASEGEDDGLAKVYGASSDDLVIRFTPREKGLIYRALFETIPFFRGRLRIFSPRCSLFSLIRRYQKNELPFYSCRGGREFFFVEAGQGRIHPCGYLSEVFDRLPDLRPRPSGAQERPACHLCEWECFRDPSEMMGPLLELFTRPWQLSAKIFKDPEFFRILLEDLRYYRACGFFNCRLPPDAVAMGRFARREPA